MNIKKLSVVSILAFSTLSALNVSYASEDIQICRIAGKIAQQAMISKQSGSSMKEIQKDMNKILKLVKQANLSKFETEFLTKLVPFVTLEVSQMDIGKTDKEKRKIINSYMEQRKNVCNSALKENVK